MAMGMETEAERHALERMNYKIELGFPTRILEVIYCTILLSFIFFLSFPKNLDFDFLRLSD